MYGNLDKSDSYFAVPCSSICIDREISHIFLRSKSSLHYWSTGVRMPEPGESLLSSKYTGDCLARVIRVITSHYPPDPQISNSGPETICVVTLCLLSLSGISDANIAPGFQGTHVLWSAAFHHQCTLGKIGGVTWTKVCSDSLCLSTVSPRTPTCE